jgi:NitT/TauT family transport system substrate-binding protein
MNLSRVPGCCPVTRLVAFALVSVLGLGALLVGCSRHSDNGAGDSGTLKVAYLGLTCEGPIYAAYENGYFKDEGLDVELVKTDWDNLRDGLGTGRFDATQHLSIFLLKPIERDVDLKLTGGTHTGCLRLQAGIDTDIKTVEDLKGKRIAVAVNGNPPMLFASRVFTDHHLDPNKDAKWLVFPNDAMEPALDSKQVDAVASAEPIGTILLAHGKVRNIADQAVDKPYADEYCCVTVVSGKLAREDPAKAAKVTRALLRGAKWVSLNQKAAAHLGVAKKYIAASEEINAQAIGKLNYEPGVTRALRDILTAAEAMHKGGLLKPSTDPKELVQRAWLDLDGVSDEWLKGVKVEKVAGGGRPRDLGVAGFAALFDGNPANCRDFQFCPCDGW